MVFFLCDGCNETLKKSKVDAHVYQCRAPVGCLSVSCVDCSVSFFGDDYRAHTSCVSEAERYEKSLYKGGASGAHGSGKKNKKNPQEKWMELIGRAAAIMPGDQSFHVPPPSSEVQRCLDALTETTNVPRKEKQFLNFVTNSMRHIFRGDRGKNVVKETWRYLTAIREAESSSGKTTTVDGGGTSSTGDVGNGMPAGKGGGVEGVSTCEDGVLDDKYNATNFPAYCPTIPKDKISKKEKSPKLKSKLQKTVSKRMMKELKKMGGTSKVKELRRAVVERIIGAAEEGQYTKEDVKVLITKLIESESKKFRVAGKHVSLIE